MRIDELRPRVNGRPEAGHGLPGIALIQRQQAELMMETGWIIHLAQCSLQAYSSGSPVLQQSERPGLERHGTGIGRSNTPELAGGEQCVGRLARFQLGTCQGNEHPRLDIEFARLGQMGDRLSRLVALHGQQTPLVPGIGQAGHQFDGAPIALLRLLVAAKIPQQVAQIREDDRLVGTGPQAGLELLQRLELAAQLTTDQRSEVQGIRLTRLGGQYPAHLPLRLSHIAGLEGRHRLLKHRRTHPAMLAQQAGESVARL